MTTADAISLLCKLDNAAFESSMKGYQAECERLENDRDELEIAIKRNDYETIQEMLAKYS